MDTYLVIFRIREQLEFAKDELESKAGLINQIIDKLKQGDVALLDFNRTHNEEIDNHCDSDEDVAEDHTLVEVRLDILEPLDGEDPVDFNDGGEDVYYYTLEALEMRKADVTYIYTCGEEPLQKTIIGIDIAFELKAK